MKSNVTIHFKWSEVVCNQGIDADILNEDVKNNATALAYYLLEPLRDKLNYPITVTSWYRTPAYNKRVGGVKNSLHLTGQAVDVYFPLQKTYYDLLRQLKCFKFDQAIVYYDELKNVRFLHLSYRMYYNRNQVLRSFTIKGKKVYQKFDISNYSLSLRKEKHKALFEILDNLLIINMLNNLLKTAMENLSDPNTVMVIINAILTIITALFSKGKISSSQSDDKSTKK